MPTLTRRDAIALLFAAPACLHSLPGQSQSAEGFSLFDGTSLRGWRVRGHATAFNVANGQIAVRGEGARLFYAGPSGQADFKNFEFSAEVMMQPGAESALCFHTTAQSVASPAPGFQVLLANDARGPNDFIQRRKTGSLYGLRHVWKQFVRDNDWFTLSILVRQKQVQVRINGMLVVDHIEPAEPFSANPEFDCRIGHGTFALQALSPLGGIFLRNLRVRPLPDAAPQFSAVTVFESLFYLDNLVDPPVVKRAAEGAGQAPAEVRRTRSVRVIKDLFHPNGPWYQPRNQLRRCRDGAAALSW